MCILLRSSHFTQHNSFEVHVLTEFNNSVLFLLLSTIMIWTHLSLLSHSSFEGHFGAITVLFGAITNKDVCKFEKSIFIFLG